MKLCLGLTLAILIIGYAQEIDGDGTHNDVQVNTGELKQAAELYRMSPESEPETVSEISKEEFLDSEDENIKQYSQIDHFTKIGAKIDISLNKDVLNEDCYIQPPGGTLTRADELNLEGVQIQNESNYVSCRITIGPMKTELIGLWKLCGKSLVKPEMRCQPVNIAWNSHNGTVNWDSYTRTRFTHPVNFGGSVHPGVSNNGVGSLTSCHVVTPSGEDLVFTDDVSYPHMDATSSNSALCSILFKDINAEMLGDWVVYGIFRSILGQHEYRFPLTFVLYNENDPYSQAYNVTTLKESQHLVREGAKSLELEVSHRTATLDNCIFRTPTGETIDQKTGYDSHSLDEVKFQYLSEQSKCVIDFLSVTKDAAGKWQIIGKFSNGNQFNEIGQKFTVVLEDPENPIEEPFDRIIESFEEKMIVTEMDTTHKLVINTTILIEIESCHLITPDGRQYAFIDGFNVPGVEIIHENGIECGVLLKLSDYNMIGRWTLIARAKRLSTHIERRQPFTISVEEPLIIQDNITVREGGDVYLHVNSTVAWPETCKLIGPDSEDWTSNVDADEIYPVNCGFIIRDVKKTHNGEWIIEHGDKVKNKESVNIVVLASQPISIDNLIWNVGEPVDVLLGPNDTIYCKIEDNNGHTVYDDFGQCKIVLDRVTVKHRGSWKMYVGLLGAVELQKHVFYVAVLERGNKPVVTTTVVTNEPDVLLTCSVPVQHEVHACKFRDPHNNILVAINRVGQSGYSFNGSFTYESNADTHNCTLRLTNPSVKHLGIWRCAWDTSTGTYYGFLTFVSPFAMEDPNVAASVITEPVLQPESKVVTYMEDESVELSCFVPAPVRYCYFRDRNGTVYNVFPGMPLSSNFGYIGSGLDGGECGIRFSSLLASDSGTWSCHVGLDSSSAEQRAIINVSVRAQMEARLIWHGASAVVEAIVNHPYTIDYCRYVRRNGHGFTMQNVPYQYNLLSTPTMCSLYITNPTAVDLHPWTVAIKVTGQDGEISATTGDLLQFEPPSNIIGEILFWLIIFTICSLLVASVFIPERGRKWTYSRASYIRSSFSRSWSSSLQKKPTVQANV